MDVVTGALPSAIIKLGELLVGEYKLQKGVKGEIRFLQSELESTKGALEKVSSTPADQLDIQDKIWARELRELSYDIEDNIDTFMVRGGGKEKAELHGIKKFIDRSVGLFRKAKIRHGIAAEIRDIKSRVEEVAKRHERYKLLNSNVARPITVDPRLFSQYDKVTELVGIEEAREEIIQILMEGNDLSRPQEKIVTIVGFGGLGKTTIADVVYKKLRAQFECTAFVSVSQTPDLKKLLKHMFYQLVGRESNKSSDVTNELREFLDKKRYFIVIDDMWNNSDWKIIKHALPGNNVGNKIIITTRILDIAEQAGVAYNLQPISLDNSRTLFFRRIFGKGDKNNNEVAIKKCPDDELAEVSDKILKKCAGVPLAIITMASLLACKARNKMVWYEVYNSVGTGLENNFDLENMRKILSFSYYELPCHLRTCLLYLSMFPEDYEIKKDRLIRMWIAEGFIQYEKSGKSLVELGESYFNELINRSMMQQRHNSSNDMIPSCCVHDMVLDLIRSLSSEENFITVVSDMGGTSPSNTIRRLSLQNGGESDVMAQATFNLQHARSVVVFQAAISVVPPLDCCRVLRVLDLEGYNLSQANSSLKYLGGLHHLRYLGLRWTSISQLPEEIGNLQFLQTLDIKDSIIFSLPSSVVQLRKLMCLYIDKSTKVPNGIGNLTCLEQLSCLGIDCSTINFIDELGQLTELRQLSIRLDEWNDKLLECLSKLQKVQELEITIRPGERSIGGLDTWVAPQHLRVLYTQHSCWFSSLPYWVNPSLLLDLTCLSIAVRELHQVDLEILGRLPPLRFLCLEVDNNLGIHQGFFFGAGVFPCLVICYLQQFMWPVVFQRGTMPMLRKLWFWPFYVREARGIPCNDGSLELGLANLPSLQDFHADLQCDGAGKEEVEQTMAALTHEAVMHPNHPQHVIYIS